MYPAREQNILEFIIIQPENKLNQDTQERRQFRCFGLKAGTEERDREIVSRKEPTHHRYVRAQR